MAATSRRADALHGMWQGRLANWLHVRRPCAAGARALPWVLVPHRYDDGGFSRGSLERPVLKRLLDDIRQDQIDVIVVH